MASGFSGWRVLPKSPANPHVICAVSSVSTRTCIRDALPNVALLLFVVSMSN